MTQSAAVLIDWQTGDQAIHQGQRVTLGLFPTSANHTPRALGHRCGLNADCRRWDLREGGTAWECTLSPITEQATPDTEAFPTVGATISDTIQTAKGAITITVQRGHFTYTIEVRNGSYRYEDQCGTAATDVEACRVASLYRSLYLREEVTEPVIRSTRIIPTGHLTDMSPSVATAILMAGVGGLIERGNPTDGLGMPSGKLTDRQIRSAGTRQWVRPIVDIVGRRRVITGCQPEIAGINMAREVLNQTTKNAA